MRIKPFLIIWIVLAIALCILPLPGLFGEEESLPAIEPTQPTTQEAESTTQMPSQSETEIITQAPTEPTENAEATTQAPTEPTTQAPSETAAPTEPIAQETVPPLTAPPTQETPDEEQQEMLLQIDALIAEVYALQESYTARLAAIEADGVSRYKALPESERTEEKKQEIVYSCVDAAYALEKECDIQIDTICAKLGYLLMRTGSSQGLVSEIRYSYAAAKTNAKNQLTERYGDLLS
ncbi:MAG: hypothetical protein E7434_06025 [Ruminococcaceae bacterium]|nr:hypothetical protein [Oscillospiraceae bacterium]